MAGTQNLKPATITTSGITITKDEEYSGKTDIVRHEFIGNNADFKLNGGDDTFIAGTVDANSADIYGGDGNDFIGVGYDNDANHTPIGKGSLGTKATTLNGEDGNDVLYGRGHVALYGGDGDDTLFATGGDVLLVGGSGTNTLTAKNAASASVTGQDKDTIAVSYVPSVNISANDGSVKLDHFNTGSISTQGAPVTVNTGNSIDITGGNNPNSISVTDVKVVNVTTGDAKDTVTVKNADDVTINTGEHYMLYGKEPGNAVSLDHVGNLSLKSGDGDDTYTLTNIFGPHAQERVRTIDGGKGHDVVKLDKGLDYFRNSNGNLMLIQDASGGLVLTGKDGDKLSLKNIEEIKFTDGTVDIAPPATPGAPPAIHIRGKA